MCLELAAQDTLLHTLAEFVFLMSSGSGFQSSLSICKAVVIVVIMRLALAGEHQLCKTFVVEEQM